MHAMLMHAIIIYRNLCKYNKQHNIQLESGFVQQQFFLNTCTLINDGKYIAE